MIQRDISNIIKNDFHKGKVLVLMGARQVGKTTLFQELSNSFEKKLLLNCDNYDSRMLLENRTSTELEQLIKNYDVVLIDEAQKVKNIGLTLKMIADLKKPVQVLVTGSVSFVIANEINEPATGRLFEYRNRCTRCG